VPSVTTRFRNTIGLPGTMAVRLQPNHPTDDPAGITASILDGLLYGCGDAVIGINPASDSLSVLGDLVRLMDDLIQRFEIPTQSCVLTHVTSAIAADRARRAGGPGVPVDRGHGGRQRQLRGDPVAAEGGPGRRTLAEARHGRRQRHVFRDRPGLGPVGRGASWRRPADLEARAYGVARAFEPLLVNTVVGFIGPEYLYDGKQIIRAGLEDHFCGKLLGAPLGVDVCYTNHAEADQDDMDSLLTLLATAGVTFIMGVPGADDVMLNYQSTSFHDALYVRDLLGLKRAPEFEAWLERLRITGADGRLAPSSAGHPLLTAGA
jgi:ethanolamine ammonia-lyase large subunit